MNKSVLTIIIFFNVNVSFAQTKTITGFYQKNIDKEYNIESSFDKNLSKENIGDNIKKLSAKPHAIGSAGSKENAEYILSLYKKWGWDASIETFHVLFPTPKTRVLEMTSPSTYTALLKEPALAEDATSGQADQLPTYNAWSADGDVTGELVSRPEIG